MFEDMKMIYREMIDKKKLFTSRHRVAFEYVFKSSIDYFSRDMIVDMTAQGYEGELNGFLSPSPYERITHLKMHFLQNR